MQPLLFDFRRLYKAFTALVHPAVLVQYVLRNCNGLNMMTLQMGVILSGDPRFYDAIRTVQDEFNQILPGLASSLN
jgi:hypothetical protein